MKVLIDSNIVVWMDQKSHPFPRRAGAIIADHGNELLLSHASVWELSIKMGIGKLAFSAPLSTVIDDYVKRRLVTLQPIRL